MSEFYIGLMSGTSLDGVDAVLLESTPPSQRVTAHAHRPMPPTLAAQLLQLNRAGDNELHLAALCANALVHEYAAAVKTLLAQARLAAARVRAIGAHGQTVRHRPGEFDGVGYTVQLNNPALLAELCGIDVVADFRSRDLAAGGQGAPLVPAFHRVAFARTGESIGVLNIGGIANLSLLSDTQTLGFDCGPGNALMDGWCLQHTGQAFDEDGRWAASGQVHEALLQTLMRDSYFELLPPKSTGRDLFNLEWLAGHLRDHRTVAPADVQATLTELTARVCAHDIQRHAPACRELIVCGGGALNSQLMKRLQVSLPSHKVASSAQAGLPPLQVEAAAFAWLARQAVHRETASLKSVTGARGARVLGAIYPA